MKVFGTIENKNYSIDKYNAYAEIEWRFLSSSQGIIVTYPTRSAELGGTVVINRARREVDYDLVNPDSGYYEHSVYASVKHLFYNNNSTFYSSSLAVTKSVVDLNDNLFVVSIGQNLYGDKIKPGSFELQIGNVSTLVNDDTYGNLFISSSGTGSYIGNLFYDKGIAVINMDTGSVVNSVTSAGITIESGSTANLTYRSNIELEQHNIAIKLNPTEFNFSPFNPTIKYLLTVTGSASESLMEVPTVGNAPPTWSLYNIMGAGVIKPYVTTIGLYNDEYQLLAIAKVSVPIQRTFDTEQIFIIRFDLDYTIGD